MSEQQLTEEAKKARREYLRAYRKKNPDKVRKWNANFWEKKAKEMEKQNGQKENT